MHAIEAAQESRLAAAGGPNDRRDLALWGVERDATNCVRASEPGVEAHGADDRQVSGGAADALSQRPGHSEHG
jgi:hypothetical protein